MTIVAASGVSDGQKSVTQSERQGRAMDSDYRLGVAACKLSI